MAYIKFILRLFVFILNLYLNITSLGPDGFHSGSTITLESSHLFKFKFSVTPCPKSRMFLNYF